MTPTELIIRTLEGKSVDRVPVMCAGLEDTTAEELFGKPLIPAKLMMLNPVTRHIIDRWPNLAVKTARKFGNAGYETHLKAAIELGFDAMWMLCADVIASVSSDSFSNVDGMKFNIVDNGSGNIGFMYSGPSLTSPEIFDDWPHFTHPDDLGHRVNKYYKNLVSKYGTDICILGQACTGIHEGIMGGIGFDRAPLWIRRQRERIKRFIDWSGSVCLAGAMAMMDAGIKVIMQGDDFAYKTGPTLNPKLSDELFGPHYTRLTKAVHDRGGKIVLHSCGDNTLLFDTFISWGFDGFHAYEPTSNVDIYKEKKLHGEKATIIGNVGVDYLLTNRSKDEEVVQEVKRLIAGLASGGRFILAPAHSLDSIPAHKFKVMIEAAREFGKYSGGIA